MIVNNKYIANATARDISRHIVDTDSKLQIDVHNDIVTSILSLYEDFYTKFEANCDYDPVFILLHNGVSYWVDIFDVTIKECANKNNILTVNNTHGNIIKTLRESSNV